MKSDFVKKGTERAPHRSLFNAAGYTDEELERPLIGVVNSFNEIVPGHMNLDKICEAVKKGIFHKIKCLNSISSFSVSLATPPLRPAKSKSQ